MRSVQLYTLLTRHVAEVNRIAARMRDGGISPEDALAAVREKAGALHEALNEAPIERGPLSKE